MMMMTTTTMMLMMMVASVLSVQLTDAGIDKLNETNHVTVSSTNQRPRHDVTTRHMTSSSRTSTSSSSTSNSTWPSTTSRDVSGRSYTSTSAIKRDVNSSMVTSDVYTNIGNVTMTSLMTSTTPKSGGSGGKTPFNLEWFCVGAVSMLGAVLVTSLVIYSCLRVNANRLDSPTYRPVDS